MYTRNNNKNKKRSRATEEKKNASRASRTQSSKQEGHMETHTHSQENPILSHQPQQKRSSSRLRRGKRTSYLYFSESVSVFVVTKKLPKRFSHLDVVAVDIFVCVHLDMVV
jgi:hypothetical protein